MHRFRSNAKAFPVFRNVGNLTRRYTPPAQALKLYEQDHHLNYKFPVNAIDSSEVRYAQFLYRLQEDPAFSNPQKSGRQHQYTDDFALLEKLNLPIFWERELDVSSHKEFQERFHENFIFLMKWMQSNGDLGRIMEVKQHFELFVNEKNKKANVSIYTPIINKEVLEKCKPWLIEKAKSFIKKEPFLLSKNNYQYSFHFYTDSTLRTSEKGALKNLEDSQFYIELAGVRINHDPHSPASRESSQMEKEAKIDYSRIKTGKSVIETEWDGNVETSILSGYFEQLAKTDHEEQVYGV